VKILKWLGTYSRKTVYFLLIFCGVILCLTSISLLQLLKLPANLRISPGQKITLSIRYPFKIELSEHFLAVSELQTFLKQSLILESPKNQTYHLQLKLFGKIPVRQFQIKIVDPPKVIPCGEAIGVLVSTKGVIIVGHVPVVGINQKQSYPAKDAGLMAGDVILSLNGYSVYNVGQVEEFIKNYKGKIITLTLKRNGKIILKKIKPVLAKKNGKYRSMLGIFIEDPAAGVGTLTFYQPATRFFAGLGHRINNFNGKNGISFHQGEIVLANISAVRPGIPGKPGEKVGIFYSSQPSIGFINKNTKFGIYGKLYKENIPQSRITGPIPIAYPSEIKTGTAYIYTVITGYKVQRFKVKIVKVFRQSQPHDKGLIIKVVDPVLLKKTGGIIQGMSGSPIIQEGRLIGAVTHVFVNDPTKGYGVLAEWMVAEIEKLNSGEKAS